MNLCPTCGGVGIVQLADRSIYCPTCHEQWKGVMRRRPGPDNTIPYARHLIEQDDIAAVLAVLTSDRLTQGPKVPEFEAALCAYTGAKYAVAVSSGTAALWCAYTAYADWCLDEDPPLTIPAITFAATANAALWSFDLEIVDVEPDTWISRSQFLVTLGGHPGPELEPDEGQEPGDMVGACIVDAAHGPMTWREWDLMRCLSFHPAKHITTGEGGAVLTDDEVMVRKLRRLRDNGRETAAETPQIVGLNLRMNEMSAALGISQLRKLAGWLARRRQIARAYREAFAPLGVKMQPDHPGHWYHLMILWLDPERWNRDIVRRNLTERGVGTTLWPGHGPLYKLPMYQQDPARFPNAERYWNGSCCVPMSHALTDGEVEHVIKSVREVLA